MAAEEFREKLNNAVGEAIGRDDDLDDIEAALEEKLDRIDEIRTARGDS